MELRTLGKEPHSQGVVSWTSREAEARGQGTHPCRRFPGSHSGLETSEHKGGLSFKWADQQGVGALVYTGDLGHFSEDERPLWVEPTGSCAGLRDTGRVSPQLN